MSTFLDAWWLGLLQCLRGRKCHIESTKLGHYSYLLGGMVHGPQLDHSDYNICQRASHQQTKFHTLETRLFRLRRIHVCPSRPRGDCSYIICTFTNGSRGPRLTIFEKMFYIIRHLILSWHARAGLSLNQQWRHQRRRGPRWRILCTVKSLVDRT
jgi:hypothetical protein